MKKAHFDYLCACSHMSAEDADVGAYCPLLIKSYFSLVDLPCARLIGYCADGFASPPTVLGTPVRVC